MQVLEGKTAVVTGAASWIGLALAERFADEGMRVVMAGVTTMPMTSVYTVSKHAALALSECLHKELAMTQSKLRASVLCPEMVDTPTKDLIVKATSDAAQKGLPPSEMADRVVAAIREERFYILAEDETWRGMCNLRCDDIVAGRDPSTVLPDLEPEPEPEPKLEPELDPEANVELDGA